MEFKIIRHRSFLEILGKFDRHGTKDVRDRRSSRKKKQFTWKLLSQYVPFFGHGTARALLHQSFNDWAKYAPITFQEVNEYDQADFELGFLPTYHDPLRRFDGLGGTLAYAYFPPSGVIRFEAEEPWTDRSIK